MEKEKLNPLEMVAREMAPHSDLLDESTIRRRIAGVLEHLHDRARGQLELDADTPEALRYSQEYLAVVELVNFFGTQLIALEDIEQDNGVAN